MFKEYCRAINLLVGMVILFFAVPVIGQQAVSEVTVQNHRCLVAGPVNLPPGAPVVFVLHGLGANAEDLLGLCEELHLPPCRFVLPDAPLSPPGYRPQSYGWYDQATHDRKDIENSRDYLFEVMNHFSTEASNPSTPDTSQKPRPVIIMGFSQGAVMSLEAGLNFKGKVEAMVSMSGCIWDAGKTLAHPAAPFKTSILLIHGTTDPLFPEDITQKTMSSLRKAGYHPVLKEFPMGHQITRDSIKEVSKFLQEVIIKNR